MATFQKRSLLEVSLLTICTLGIYHLYWSVMTKRELNRAGGHVPTAWLVILPLINIYFWYRYAQAYVTIVRRNNSRGEVFAYWLVAVAPAISSFTGLGRIFGGELKTLLDVLVSHILPYTNISINLNYVNVGFTVLAVLGLAVARIYIFQEGYNNYRD